MPTAIEVLDGLAADPNTVAFDEIIDFSTEVPAGSSAKSSQRVTASKWFAVDAILATVYIPSASGSAIAGTAIPADSVTLQNSNTFPSLAHFRAQIWTNGVQWFSNPKRLNLLAGTAAAPNLPLTKRLVPGGGTVTIELFNDSALPVKAQFAFDGRAA
jgi:hypothetical protein